MEEQAPEIEVYEYLLTDKPSWIDSFQDLFVWLVVSQDIKPKHGWLRNRTQTEEDIHIAVRMEQYHSEVNYRRESKYEATSLLLQYHAGVKFYEMTRGYEWADVRNFRLGFGHEPYLRLAPWRM